MQLNRRRFVRGFVALVMAIHGITLSVIAGAHAPPPPSRYAILSSQDHPADQVSHDELRCPLCIYAVQQQSPIDGPTMVAERGVFVAVAVPTAFHAPTSSLPIIPSTRAPPSITA